MNEAEGRGPVATVLRAVGRFIVTVAVVAYSILDALFFPLLRPIWNWLGSLRLFELLGAAIGRLPPYAALVLLAVPFVLIEPLKIVALWWGAVGHPVQGLVLLIVAEIGSVLICERIYHAAHGPLMRIGWFRRLMGWIVGLRDRALAMAEGTAAWKWAAGVGLAVREWVRGVLASVR